MGMNNRYTARAGQPGERLAVDIDSRRAGRVEFEATLTLRRRELTRARRQVSPRVTRSPMSACSH